MRASVWRTDARKRDPVPSPLDRPCRNFGWDAGPLVVAAEDHGAAVQVQPRHTALPNP